MNNKEFIDELARRTEKTSKSCSDSVAKLVAEMAELLSDENTIAIQGFGTFEVKKRLERVVVNPATRQQMLVPPKMALSFKPSQILKDRYK